MPGVPPSGGGPPPHTGASAARASPGAPRDDGELLAAHRAGDPQAFGELAGRHAGALWAIALGVLGDHHDAADAVQEALVAAFRRAATFRGDAPVRAWLGRIVINACYDRVRHERVRRADPWPERDVPAPRTDLAVELATRMAVREALALLPVGQRAAVVLVDVQGYPVAEVGTMLGVPPGTVKSRCARGRARLAVLLGHLREEEP